MELIKRKSDGEIICQKISDKIQFINHKDNKLVEMSTEKLYEILNEEFNSATKNFRSLGDSRDDIRSLFSEELYLSIDDLGFYTGYPVFRCNNINGEICSEYGCVPYVHLFVDGAKGVKHPDREEGYYSCLVIDFRRVIKNQNQEKDKCQDVRMGIFSKEMNADEFHELQRNPLSMWDLLQQTIAEYKKHKEEQAEAEKSRHLFGKKR